ncbi:hypothetical protein LUZ60_007805 [Juncus effusus]|nr:hypothetical protein LUZ60_007805 [Juncus effusus]
MRGLVFDTQEEHEEFSSPVTMSSSQENGSSVNQDILSDNKTIWISRVDGSLRKMRQKPTASEVYGLELGEKILVELDERGCPNNYARYLLGAFAADLVRTGAKCPIHYSRGDNEALIPVKKELIETIERKFKYHEKGRSWVIDKLHESWRSHKTFLKGKYFDGKPLQEVLDNIPHEVEAAQWNPLVVLWNEPKKKKQSATNSANARKQVHYHTGGRKSIARKRKEMMDENSGKEPNRLTLWDATHKRKDGTYANEATKEKMVEANHLLETRAGGLEQVPEEVVNNVFLEVMGPEHGGRVRGMGLGPKPRDFYGITYKKFPNSSENEVGVEELVEKKIAEIVREHNKDKMIAETKHQKELSTVNRKCDMLLSVLSRVCQEVNMEMPINFDEESPEPRSSHSSYGPNFDRRESV